MGDLVWILMSAMVVNNFTLALFLGLCPFMGVSAKVGTALRMGGANIFVLTITAPVDWAIYHFFLAEGAMSWTGVPLGRYSSNRST